LRVDSKDATTKLLASIFFSTLSLARSPSTSANTEC
jgi:hypothetical protein